MIRRIYDDLPPIPVNSIEAQKILALWLAYSSKFEFCRFFAADNFVLCEQEGSVVVCTSGNCNYNELAEFLLFCGTREVFCSGIDGENISKHLDCDLQFVNQMRFKGASVSCQTEHNPPLTEVFEVIKAAYGLSDKLFEPWYLDMSHQIRHNISEVRRLDDSVLVIQYNLNGNVLLSQVATVPQKQRNGNASVLISAVCAEYADKNVEVICTDELVSFYERNGFSFISKKCILYTQK